MSLSQALVRDLRATITSGGVVTGLDERVEAGRDFWAQRGIPGVVVRAHSAEDVAATLHFAQMHGIPVVPRGAGTNVGGGFLASEEGILLDLRGMNQVLEIDLERRIAVVEPGVLNGDLQERLAPFGLCYSPDPASAPLSSIGGNIAENSGGPHCLKHGVTVHHVDSIDCVLLGGEAIHLSAADAGPDLLGVMIGSEGTLAVTTQATLRLRPLPAMTSSLLAVFDDLDVAIDAVGTILRAGVIPAALEFMDLASVKVAEAMAPTGYPTDADAILLIDIEGSDEEVAAQMAAIEANLRQHAREVRRADDPTERATLWRGRLQIGQATLASGRAFYIGDTTVPRERIPLMQRSVRSLADRYQLDVFTTGHAGDGNIHPIVLFDGDDPAEVERVRTMVTEWAGMALELGGTLTGEHGVGSEKRPLMRQRFGAAEIAAMRSVKRAFDPDGLLNPGVLLPEPSDDEPALPRFNQAIAETVSSLRIRQMPEPVATNARDNGDGDVIEIDVENLTVSAPGSASLRQLQRHLAERGFRTLIGDGAREPTRTLRSILSDAAVRADVRASLLAVESVLPDGQPVRFGSKAVKDVAGYDLKRLYIGSGDAFGAVREVTLQIRPG
ncbi:MAG: FAD-linked oxidase C-terminal domain-containing protein [Nitrolancea sp.]